MPSTKPPERDDAPTVGEDLTSDLAADFSEAARALFSAGSFEDTLAQVASLAVTTLEACDYAGILLGPEGGIMASACTDALVADLDTIQRRFDEGPSLDAIAHGLTSYAGEVGEDTRWPSFGPAAAAKGVRSVLALPIRAEGLAGALDLYACYPQAFGVIDRARGLLLASLGGIASSVARSHENEERRSANLLAAVATRELIGQAQGILIERERITADQAFGVLRQASQHLNLKLREVAQKLVDTGERPETGTPGRR